jgi:hypothetical protein
MIGFYVGRSVIRGAAKLAKGPGKSAGPKPPTFGMIASTPDGRTALLIFFLIFCAAVVVVGGYFTYMNARY